MLRAAIIFFVFALVAYVLGANGIAGLSLDIGKIFVIVFLVLALISLLGGVLTGRKPRQLF